MPHQDMPMKETAMNEHHPKPYKLPDRLAPAMRMLKAFHSASTPEDMTPEELERQRKSQEFMGNLTD